MSTYRLTRASHFGLRDEIRVRVRRRDGRWFWVSLVCEPVPCPHGGRCMIHTRTIGAEARGEI